MKEIPLGRGYVAKVDDADHAWLSRWRWFALVVPGKRMTKVYAVRREGGRQFYMHREILGADELEVDHKDGDGLNNQRGNLRQATRTQNNRHVRKNRGSTPYLGVFYCDPDKYPRYAERPYKAYIRVNRKLYHIGYFVTAEEAAYARDVYAVEAHGEFASLNFPERFSA